jgi:hypothetical protein
MKPKKYGRTVRHERPLELPELARSTTVEHARIRLGWFYKAKISSNVAQLPAPTPSTKSHTPSSFIYFCLLSSSTTTSRVNGLPVAAASRQLADECAASAAFSV